MSDLSLLRSLSIHHKYLLNAVPHDGEGDSESSSSSDSGDSGWGSGWADAISAAFNDYGGGGNFFGQDYSSSFDGGSGWNTAVSADAFGGPGAGYMSGQPGGEGFQSGDYSSFGNSGVSGGGTYGVDAGGGNPFGGVNDGGFNSGDFGPGAQIGGPLGWTDAGWNPGTGLASPFGGVMSQFDFSGGLPAWTSDYGAYGPVGQAGIGYQNAAGNVSAPGLVGGFMDAGPFGMFQGQYDNESLPLNAQQNEGIQGRDTSQFNQGDFNSQQAQTSPGRGGAAVYGFQGGGDFGNAQQAIDAAFNQIAAQDDSALLAARDTNNSIPTYDFNDAPSRGDTFDSRFASPGMENPGNPTGFFGIGQPGQFAGWDGVSNPLDASTFGGVQGRDAPSQMNTAYDFMSGGPFAGVAGMTGRGMDLANTITANMPWGNTITQSPLSPGWTGNVMAPYAQGQFDEGVGKGDRGQIFDADRADNYQRGVDMLSQAYQNPGRDNLLQDQRALQDAQLVPWEQDQLNFQNQNMSRPNAYPTLSEFMGPGRGQSQNIYAPSRGDTPLQVTVSRAPQDQAAPSRGISNSQAQVGGRGLQGQMDSLLAAARTAPTQAARIAALDALNGLISANYGRGPNQSVGRGPYGGDPDPFIAGMLQRGR